MKLISITKSEDGKHKYKALFEIDGKEKTTQFGAAGYDDFTKTKNTEQKELYLKRHKERENWSDPTTAGALSRWILWNKPTLKGSITDFKKRFNL